VPQDNIRISAALRLCGFALSSNCIDTAKARLRVGWVLVAGGGGFRFNLFIPLCIGGQRVSVAGAILSVGQEEGFYGKVLCLFDSIFQLSYISLSLAPWLGWRVRFKLSSWRRRGDVPAARGGLRRANPLYM
jgi:hypothetical protein